MLLHFGIHFLCSIVSCLPHNSPVRIQDVQESGVSVSTGAQISRKHSLISDLSVLNTSKPPLVSTLNGWLEGYFQKTIKGRSIAAFEGIPYGKSPSGDRRFRNPEPVDSWNGIRPATRKGPNCLQIDIFQAFRIHGDEDCLCLNVYTPVLPSLSKHLLPVIVFIHGDDIDDIGGFEILSPRGSYIGIYGGFVSGSSTDYGPAYMLDKDVVLVTFNYRLGVLGFLSTGDETASGNWGLKDQVLALRWVAKNIKNFGGDPEKVTISGESAGAASVGLHLVSKMSNGLFHRAISQSGSSLNPWAIHNHNETFSNSKFVANGVNCPTEDPQAMVTCLRHRSSNSIVARTFKTWKYFLIGRFPFGPVIEAPGTIDRFLDEAPEVSYLNGRVKPIPMIIGFNKDEGALFAAVGYLTPLMMGTINRDFSKVMSHFLDYEDKTNDTESVSRKIQGYYLKGQTLSFWNRRGWIEMFGDRIINQGVKYVMQYHSTVAPTYGYVLSYQGKNSLISTVGLDKKDWGVTHLDELIYMYNSTLYPPLEYGTKDYALSDFVLNLWTNFARTGKAAYVDEKSGKASKFWKPISNPEDVEVLNIDKVPEMVKFPFKERLQFWESLNLKDDPVFKYPIKFS